jgi:hypothetical protein
MAGRSPVRAWLGWIPVVGKVAVGVPPAERAAGRRRAVRGPGGCRVRRRERVTERIRPRLGGPLAGRTYAGTQIGPGTEWVLRARKVRIRRLGFGPPRPVHARLSWTRISGSCPDTGFRLASFITHVAPTSLTRGTQRAGLRFTDTAVAAGKYSARQAGARPGNRLFTRSTKLSRPSRNRRSRHQRGGAQRWHVHSAHSVPGR